MYTSDSDVTAPGKMYNVDSSFDVERTTLSFAILGVVALTTHLAICAVASVPGFVAVGLAMYALRDRDPAGIK